MFQSIIEQNGGQTSEDSERTAGPARLFDVFDQDGNNAVDFSERVRTVRPLRRISR